MKISHAPTSLPGIVTAPLPDPSPDMLLELLHCLARAVQGEARQRAVDVGLLPVHGQVLWFLRAANRYSNTLQVLADYLGQTKGTVSQTVQLLERKGLVSRATDASDRRVTRLGLTPEGERVLSQIGADSAWSAALQSLGQHEVGDANKLLTMLLGNWQRERDGTSFGVCHSCAHFRSEPGGTYRCGLTGEPLSDTDRELICREHRFPLK